MFSIRPATAPDRPFLDRVIAVAADWRADTSPRPVEDVLADPGLVHYVDGWPRPGDLGVVADDLDGNPIGAAWLRAFGADDPGYGFVAADVPELSIGVVATARGVGVGRALMEALLSAAQDEGLDRISLSVEPDNPARRLYLSLGFVDVAVVDGATTMVLHLGRG